jgi:hypothetical protein
VTRAVALLLTVLGGFSQPSAPARLGVRATEFHFALSRASIRAGRAVIQLQNFGEDSHDLRLRRIGGNRTYAIPVTAPGKQASIQLRLLPGRYRLWCSVANHAQLGMRAVLRVRR